MINEDTVAGDMAQAAEPLGMSCRGLQCFDVEDSHEFHSFHKGIKTFHRWNKHTKSEEIRKWARNNPGKSFYVHHHGNYMKVNREKARDIVESIDLCEEYNLILEAIDFNNKDSFWKSVKEIAKKLYNAIITNEWEVIGMYEHALRNALNMGKQFLDDTIQKWLDKLEAKKWKDSLMVEFTYFLYKEYKGA